MRDPKLEQFWRAKLTAWQASGLNVRDFCRKHRLTEPSFYAWRRELAARDGTAIPKPVVISTEMGSAFSVEKGNTGFG